MTLEKFKVEVLNFYKRFYEELSLESGFKTHKDHDNSYAYNWVNPYAEESVAFYKNRWIYNFNMVTTDGETLDEAICNYYRI